MHFMHVCWLVFAISRYMTRARYFLIIRHVPSNVITRATEVGRFFPILICMLIWVTKGGWFSFLSDDVLIGDWIELVFKLFWVYLFQLHYEQSVKDLAVLSFHQFLSLQRFYYWIDTSRSNCRSVKHTWPCAKSY